MLIFFGTSGDLGYLQKLATEAGLSRKTIATGTAQREDVTVDYFTFLMTRGD